MQAALAPFFEAHATGLAQPVAEFLSPHAPTHDPGRLYALYRASNDDKIEGDVRYAFKYGKAAHISQKESAAWSEIIVAYWRAVRDIIRADEAANQGRLGFRQHVAVYDAWKDMTSLFIKNVSNGSLPAWAIFTLYFTANHLRKLAIRADEQLAQKPQTFNTSFSEDIVSTVARNEKLEEAARVFNRIFALCLGDRCVAALPCLVLLFLTSLQKPRHVRVSQVGCLLCSQSSIQDVLQGNRLDHDLPRACANPCMSS
jgi:hypothetical protein